MKQLFNTEGLSYAGNAWDLSGDGVPGTSDRTINAPLGSTYRDHTAGKMYQKVTAGSGSDKWIQLVSATDLENAIAAHADGVSWREPVAVFSATAYATKADAEAALNSALGFDGVSLADGNRVLLPGVGGNSNSDIFVVRGTPGAGATLAEDSSKDTAGDQVPVNSGTESNKIAYFTVGGTWEIRSPGTDAEQTYLRAFIGKGGAGTEMPSYTSVNYVTQGSDLEAAIGALDAQTHINTGAIANEAASRANADSAIQAEVDALEVSLGAVVNGNGVYQARNDTHYLNGNATVDEDLRDLDALAKTNSDAIGALQGALGSTVYAGAVSGVTASTVIDTVAVDDAAVAKWIVQVFDETTPANKEMVEILGANDGTASADATDANWTEYSRLRFGSAIAGLTYEVDVFGSGVVQTMRLKVAANSPVTVKLTRLKVQA